MHPRTARALLVLLSLGGIAAAPAEPAASGATAELGAWFERGVQRIDTAAADLWAAGKAAFAAGARTLQEREARERASDPAAAAK